MRVRLFVLLLTLIGLVVAALQVPLAFSYAVSAQQRVFIDRLNDTDRFASIARNGLSNQDVAALEPELRRYDQVYGIPVAIVDRQGRLVVASRDGIDLRAPEVRDRIAVALSGRRAEEPLVLWPWDDRPLVVAAPYGTGGEVSGVVVTVSPTERLRSRVARVWYLLGLAALLALMVSAALAAILARWVLRPVSSLDGAAHALAEGDLDTRVPESTGPPELRRLAHSFNDMAATVSSSLEQQRVFVAEASHQMRNPLTALLLRLGNIADDLPRRARREYEEAASEGARLQRVLDELLALARAERHLGAVRAHDVGPLLDDRLGAWRLRAERHDQILVREGEASAAAVVDAESFGRALDEVLDNATKYAPEGGVVRAAVHTADDTVRVSVTDDGEGLAAAEMGKVTDRFWRAKAHANVPGSGLGMSIVATLLQTFGGHVEVAPASPHGLTVTLVLPRPVGTPGPVTTAWSVGGVGEELSGGLVPASRTADGTAVPGARP